VSLGQVVVASAVALALLGLFGSLQRGAPTTTVTKDHAARELIGLR
jgi:hypothetical protein